MLAIMVILAHSVVYMANVSLLLQTKYPKKCYFQPAIINT